MINKNSDEINYTQANPQSNIGLWSRQPDAVTRWVANEFVIIPIRQSKADFQKIFSLNEAGIFLWEQLQKPKSREELTAALTANFEVSEQQAQQDVETFLLQLQARNLVTLSN